MAMAEVVVASWSKNSRETLQVKLSSYKGQAIIDCRSWYVAASDGALKPGRGGLTVSVRHLPRLAEALGKAVEIATATGLLPGDDSQNA